MRRGRVSAGPISLIARVVDTVKSQGKHHLRLNPMSTEIYLTTTYRSSKLQYQTKTER